jgi:Kef-type K+ transport system membrane component KefB
VISVQLLQDFLLVGMLVLVSAWPQGWIASLFAIGKSTALLGLAVILQTTIVPRVLAKTRLGDETLLMLMLSLLFAFGGAAAALGLPLVVGAFLAGLSISRFPANGLLRVQLAALGDFFFAIFFVTLGYIAGLPAADSLPEAAGLVLIVVLLRPLVVTFLARTLGLSVRPAVESSLLLGQAGELGLVIGLVGLGNGSLDAPEFSLLAAVVAFTMMLTPFLATDKITSWLLHLLPRRHPPAPGSFTGQGRVLGAGGASAAAAPGPAGAAPVDADARRALAAAAAEARIQASSRSQTRTSRWSAERARASSPMWLSGSGVAGRAGRARGGERRRAEARRRAVQTKQGEGMVWPELSRQKKDDTP